MCTTNVLRSFSTCEFLTLGPGARQFAIYSATIYTFVHARLTALYNRVHAHDWASTLQNQPQIHFACYSLPSPETFRFWCNVIVPWRVLYLEHSSLKCFRETIENVRLYWNNADGGTIGWLTDGVKKNLEKFRDTKVTK